MANPPLGELVFERLDKQTIAEPGETWERWLFASHLIGKNQAR